MRADNDEGSEEDGGRPEARTMAPVVRERIRVDLTPDFCARRARSAVVSSGWIQGTDAVSKGRSVAFRYLAPNEGSLETTEFLKLT